MRLLDGGDALGTPDAQGQRGAGKDDGAFDGKYGEGFHGGVS
jgi:hypothetical protein